MNETRIWRIQLNFLEVRNSSIPKFINWFLVSCMYIHHVSTVLGGSTLSSQALPGPGYFSFHTASSTSTVNLEV